MITWRKGPCGNPHEWGLCNNSDHQRMDTEEVSQSLLKPVEASERHVADDTLPPLNRSVVVQVIRDHALTSAFIDGTMICKCGYTTSLSWFSEHLAESVGSVGVK